MSKKTTELIVNSGNDYVIAVKANQKSLYQQIRLNTEQSTPISTDTTIERTRDRVTSRTVEVFDNLIGISLEWVGLKTLVKVQRTGTRKGKLYQQTAYYISSLKGQAQVFAQGIRGHWGIENRLHWVKDVVLDEDNSRIRSSDASANLSIIRSITINLLRQHGYSSVTTAKRLIANDLEKLFVLLQ